MHCRFSTLFCPEAKKLYVSSFFTVFACLFFLSEPCRANSPPTLYIYNPSYTKAHAMQKKIGAICPSLEVHVYGKAKDFKKHILSSAPDATISLPDVIKPYTVYKTLLEGQREQSQLESYYLVSLGNALSVSELSKKKIGVIDLLGRKAMRAFIRSLLGDVAIKRVGKAEDLLPLLNFNGADALFISDSDLTDLKEVTRLKLKVTRTDIRLGLPVVSYLKQSDRDVISDCVSRFDPVVNNYLRVEKWRKAL